MRLQEIIDGKKVITIEQLESDTELLLEVQQKCADLSLYPKDLIDGLWGPKIEAALSAFCSQHHLNNLETGLFGSTFAKALLDAQQIKITLITADQARRIFGRSITPEQLSDLNACMVRFEINTSARLRHFVSQIAHESGGGRWMKELASGAAYEGRRDLGNTQPNDGRRFKGAGVIQLTGRSNYQAFANFMGDPRIMEGCNYVSQKYPFTSAGFFWMSRRINNVIDKGGDIYRVTRIINGGLNGIEDRKRYYAIACLVIV